LHHRAGYREGCADARSDEHAGEPDQPHDRFVSSRYRDPNRPTRWKRFHGEYVNDNRPVELRAADDDPGDCSGQEKWRYDGVEDRWREASPSDWFASAAW
jgi:hypothetical protein